MTKTALMIFTLALAFSAHAQSANNGKPKTEAIPPKVEPKATKKDAKAQCREEGRTGKALIDCIKEKSGS